MSMWTHTVQWRAGLSAGSMPMPTLVTPTYKIEENVVKAGGRRYRKRKGVWAGCKIHWDSLLPSELAQLDALLAAENDDAVPFELSLDAGALYRYAQLSKDIDPKPTAQHNVALDVTLEFEFRDREASFPSPLHLGA